MLVYATPAELRAAVPGSALTDDQLMKLIGTASQLVRAYTKRVIYSTTPGGAPRDAELALAFREAVVAQAAYWVNNDLDPAVPVTAVPQKVSIGSASFDLGQVTAEQSSSFTSLLPQVQLGLDELLAYGSQPWEYR